MLQEVVQTTMNMVGASSYNRSLMGIERSAFGLTSSISTLVGQLPGVQTAIGAAFGALALSRVTHLGSEFENTRLKMAGFLTALGESQDFTQGLNLAETVMKKIELTAAALPGEAEDYVRVFTTALPSVQKSLGGTLDEMVAFTNQIAAVGSTFGIDSMQIANDLKRLLQVGRGGAGLDVRTFSEMLPFLQQIEGQANLNTESFNKMTAPERAKLLQSAMGQLQPMIDGATNSWDALSGTVAATLKTMTRYSTEPLFEGLKQGASTFSGLLMDSNGTLTDLGTNIVAAGQLMSSYLVGATRVFIEGLGWIRDNGFEIFNRLFGMHLEVFERAFAFDPTTGTFVGPVVDAADDLVNALLVLSDAVLPVWDALQGFRAMMEDTLLTVLPYATDAFLTLLEPLAILIAGVSAVSLGITEMLWPAIQTLGEGFGELVSSIANFLQPIIQVLGYWFIQLYTMLKDYLGPVVGFVIDSLGRLMSAIADVINFFAKIMGENAELYLGQDDMAKERERFSGSFDSVFKLFDQIGDEFKVKKAKLTESSDFDVASAVRKQRKLPGGRTGTKITQDFRNSRFNIQQEFAEGFDPDRIAIAFAKDLQKIGEQRLQSGFEPAFTLR